MEPSDPECPCPCCTKYSLAYLHHLFKAKEMVGDVLASLHNMHFIARLMAKYRQKILDNEL